MWNLLLLFVFLLGCTTPAPSPSPSSSSRSMYLRCKALLEEGKLNQASQYWQKIRPFLSPKQRQILATIGASLWREKGEKYLTQKDYFQAYLCYQQALSWRGEDSLLKKELQKLKKDWKQELLFLIRSFPNSRLAKEAVEKRLSIFPKEKQFWKTQISRQVQALQVKRLLAKIQHSSFSDLELLWKEVEKIQKFLSPKERKHLALLYQKASKHFEKKQYWAMAARFLQKALTLSPNPLWENKLLYLQKQLEKGFPFSLTVRLKNPPPTFRERLTSFYLSQKCFKVSPSSPFVLSLSFSPLNQQKGQKKEKQYHRIQIKPIRPNPLYKKLQKEIANLRREIDKEREYLEKLKQEYKTLMRGLYENFVTTYRFQTGKVSAQYTKYRIYKLRPQARRHRRRLFQKSKRLKKEIQRRTTLVEEKIKLLRKKEQELLRTPLVFPAEYKFFVKERTVLYTSVSASVEISFWSQGKLTWQSKVFHQRSFSDFSSFKQQIFWEELFDKVFQELRRFAERELAKIYQKRVEIVARQGKEIWAKELWLRYQMHKECLR